MRAAWTLTGPAFRSLLERLDQDAALSGEKFEALRRSLIVYLAWGGSHDPERWADTVLDRLAKRLSEGVEIADVNAWTRGAARLVLHEIRVEESRAALALRDSVVGAQAARSTPRDAEALERCLNFLPKEQRVLLERYYQAGQGNLIESRKQQADELGISLEAPRNRALRIRKQVEKCLGSA